MVNEDLVKINEELKRLLSQAIYARTKTLLNSEILKIEKELIAVKSSESEVKSTGQNSTSAAKTRVEINEHAFDESDKFVKIHIPFTQTKISDENVTIEFTEESFYLTISGESKDYVFIVKNLLKPINVEKSYKKVKDDMISVYLKKVKEGTKWEVLTKTAKVLKDQKNKAFDDDKESKSTEDPMGGLMNIMKKMYESGDPEMKRTIAKAWTEGQEKRNQDGMGMGGMGF